MLGIGGTGDESEVGSTGARGTSADCHPACTGGRICTRGVCACPHPGDVLCSKGCTNPKTDNFACGCSTGTAGRVCPVGEECCNGRCVPCPSGQKTDPTTCACAGSGGRTYGTWRECETSTRQICGTWEWNGKDGFRATWENGASAAIHLDKDDGSTVVLTRRDAAGASAGLAATYTGTRSGSTISGSVTWTWKGKTTTGTWLTR
ncbi:MAG: hypothetical protein HY744_27280 [Deltaproteobacteria bacterium]|nr:hypothetical protein [Deltaproteobacteria bacterium]